MTTSFEQLNHGWNAEPNAPAEIVTIAGTDVELSFSPNPFQFPAYAEIARIVVRFSSCAQYRLGATNDEGWYRGQCRFSGAAPAWGEFYELRGDLLDERVSDWIPVGGSGKRRFLFYLRDSTFECDAAAWEKTELPGLPL